MLSANKAAARLQDQWDTTFRDTPCEIKKLIGKPKSSGAVGWTWFIIFPDGEWFDLGYTEEKASRAIRYWNEPYNVAWRKYMRASRNLSEAIGIIAKKEGQQ